MDSAIATPVLVVISAALIGGAVAKLFRLQPILGYIIAGIISSIVFPLKGVGIEKLTEIGTVLLLFSIGIELSLDRLGKVLKIATLGALSQIFLVTILIYYFLTLTGFKASSALILSAGFSISSTALLVKILSDRGEIDTIHGEVMIGWSLVQDLVVVPMMVLLPSLAGIIHGEGSPLLLTAKALGYSGAAILITLVLGKLVVPYLIHKVASVNSRELMVLAGLALALGTAVLTSFFGVSAALGAFLAGVVISESQENHAIFAETRPLRDLFVALFFVSLGFMVNPGVLIQNFWLILALVILVITIKLLVVFVVSLGLGYHGKTAIATSFGLAQVGEFSFVMFSIAKGLNIISSQEASIGIVVGLITLMITPLLYKGVVPFWRKLKESTSKWPRARSLILGWDRQIGVPDETPKGHIIIVGYGRVGGWVGKALRDAKVEFIVVDYDQKVVNKLKSEGEEVIYGDPTEPEILETAGLTDAKAIIIAIPDRFAQEELIAYVQTKAPNVKIITRAHLDEDIEKLKLLKVDKVVQPEFEAAVAIIRSIFVTMGKPKEEVSERIKNLRLSKAMT